jgi:hypothetical protein
MSAFKPKNSKKIILINKTNTTLDSKHKEITDSFTKEINEVLPKLQDEKKNLLNLLKNSNISIDEKLNIEDKIIEIKNKIKTIKYNEKEYLLKNSQYIFDYFEDKKKISEINKQTTTLVDNFFKLKNFEIDNNIELKQMNNIKKYFLNINESFLDIDNYVLNTDICRFCKKGEMIPIEHEGILVCNSCSNIIKYIVENEKPSYKDPPKEVCFYAYKRINHFREILAQFQAKESTQIPEEVIENIKLQIKKERIDISQLNNKRAKEILKKLGYNKYYEHIPFIKDRLGIKPPIMSSELEELLCNLFMDIQSPYAKYCPDDRVNFLNYYYTIYKLCELLDQIQFLPYFPMLKDREKRIEQDEIWKKICNELEWEFIPTV